MKRARNNLPGNPARTVQLCVRLAPSTLRLLRAFARRRDVSAAAYLRAAFAYAIAFGERSDQIGSFIDFQRDGSAGGAGAVR